MLRTLGFRIPAEHLDLLLGQVAVYPWNADFADTWQRLPRRQSTTGRPTRPAYRHLLAGLTAVHGRPVHIVDEWKLREAGRPTDVKGMIITTDPIKPFYLSTCLRTFERSLRNGDDQNSLAPLLPTADTSRRFSDHITTTESGTAIAPGWLFDTAAWSIMARLTQPLRLEDGGPTLPLRMDTDGSLLAWDNPVSNQWKGWIGYAMLRIQPKIVTLPRVADLVITFDAHLSRINDSWRGSKTAWIERDDVAKPILRAPIRSIPPRDDDSAWTQEIADHGAAIARSCGMEGLDLDSDLPAAPGAVRPLVSGPRMHPVGKGPGARLMLRLAEHVEALCPELEPLRWERDKKAKIKTPRRQVLGPANQEKKEVSVSPENIVAAVNAAAGGNVRLLCIYASSDARQRMTDQLRTLSNAATPPTDGEATEITESLKVSFHRAVDLLRHGGHNRLDLIDEIRAIVKESDETMLAWVETKYDPRTGSPKDDAKNLVRRLLSELGIASQFLATKPVDDDATPKKRPSKRRSTSTQTNKDHPAASAAADLLLRTTGVVHQDLRSPIIGDFLTGTPHQRVHLVGLHTRLQHSGTRGAPPRLVITSAAIEANADNTSPWPATMWDDTASAWVGYPRATADFHAGRIGSQDRGRSGSKLVETRHYVESILDALPAGPVVLFVDAVATRTMWPGLQNQHFRTALLPGVNISTSRSVAIVRCNTSREVPRPVDRQGGQRPRKDHRQPATPDRYLYRNDVSGVWLFAKSSRTYRAQGGRLGATCTPWTIPDKLRHLLQDDWHAYTATEIAVAQTGIWPELDLVTLTARLCDHTITWDDRTLSPMPLHLASRVGSVNFSV